MVVEKIREALEAKRAEAQKVWADFETKREVLTADGFDPTKDKEAFESAHEISKTYDGLRQEVDDLTKQWEQALEMEGINPVKESPFDNERDEDGKSKIWTPGERFTGSDEMKTLQSSGVLDMEKGRVHTNPVKALSREEVKTLLTGGGAPGTQLLRNERLPGIMPLLQAPLQLTNLITVGSTDSNVIEWVRQSAIANNAAEVAEATATTGVSGTKPESGMTFVIESTPVRTIAHWIPATKQALQDMPQLRTIVDGVLIDGIARRLNNQILNGDGVAPNLLGILGTAGVVTQAFAVDAIQTILRAMTTVRLAYFEPSAILMHPLDFVNIRLLRDLSGGAGTGQYLFGPPSQSGVETLWGLRIVQDVNVAQGAPVVADWRQAILYVRDSVNVLATDSHADFFVRNLVAILAEGRYAVAVPRPQAFVVADITA